jgi:hypothetical protein
MFNNLNHYFFLVLAATNDLQGFGLGFICRRVAIGVSRRTGNSLRKQRK